MMDFWVSHVPLFPLPRSLAAYAFSHAAFSYFSALVCFVSIFMLALFSEDKKSREFLMFCWKIFFVTLAGIFLGGYMAALLLLLIGMYLLKHLFIAARTTFGG
jgi:hypothetical protein